MYWWRRLGSWESCSGNLGLESAGPSESVRCKRGNRMAAPGRDGRFFSRLFGYIFIADP